MCSPQSLVGRIAGGARRPQIGDRPRLDRLIRSVIDYNHGHLQSAGVRSTGRAAVAASDFPLEAAHTHRLRAALTERHA